jgi:hypothetical protein
MWRKFRRHDDYDNRLPDTGKMPAPDHSVGFNKMVDCLPMLPRQRRRTGQPGATPQELGVD